MLTFDNIFIVGLIMLIVGVIGWFIATAEACEDLADKLRVAGIIGAVLMIGSVFFDTLVNGAERPNIEPIQIVQELDKIE